MPLLTWCLERPVVYRLWQAPFALKKLEPFCRYNDLHKVRRVLDVGCGPGTNSSLFAGSEYLGLDINPRYVEYASRHFEGRFEVVDAARLRWESGDRFDCVLINSLLHHLSDDEVGSLLPALCDALDEHGWIHCLELVRPESGGIDGLLAKADRGRFARTIDEWRALVGRHLELTVVEPYTLGLSGVVLWNMVYLRGRRR